MAKHKLDSAGPGRPKGSVNKVTEQMRHAFALLVEGNLDNLSKWLELIAKEDPARAMGIIIEISERFVPKLARTELDVTSGGEKIVGFNYIKPDGDNSDTSANL